MKNTWSSSMQLASTISGEVDGRKNGCECFPSDMKSSLGGLGMRLLGSSLRTPSLWVTGFDRRRYCRWGELSTLIYLCTRWALTLLTWFREEFLGDGIFNRDDEVSVVPDIFHILSTILISKNIEMEDGERINGFWKDFSRMNSLFVRVASRNCPPILCARAYLRFPDLRKAHHADYGTPISNFDARASLRCSGFVCALHSRQRIRVPLWTQSWYSLAKSSGTREG